MSYKRELHSRDITALINLMSCSTPACFGTCFSIYYGLYSTHFFSVVNIVVDYKSYSFSTTCRCGLKVLSMHTCTVYSK